MAKVSIRVPDTDLEKIDGRAQQLGMSRTALILRAVLGTATADEQRLEHIEDRLGRVEEALFTP